MRVAEATCPFCEAALPADLARAVKNAVPRSRRRAAIFFASTLAVAGCGSDDTSTTPPTDSGADTQGADATTDTPTDAPPTDGTVDATDATIDAPVDAADSGRDADADTGGIAPPYGIPPSDGG